MGNVRKMVIGVGNRQRGDDAAGILVVERLSLMQSPKDVVTLTSEGGLNLMEQWKDAQSVIVVDAVRSGKPAGSIVRIDSEELDLLPAFGSVSSHGFGIGETVKLARALGSLPPQLVFYGIEARQFAPGAELSPEVANALEATVQLIVEELGCTSLA